MNSVEHLDDIPLDLPLYIYGAGEGGRFLLDQLRSAGRHEVLGFVDSFKAGGTLVPRRDQMAFAQGL